MSIECINSSFDLNKLPTPTKDILLFVDTIEYKETDKFKLYFQHEPVAINNSILEIGDTWEKYDLIITYNKEVLSKAPNAIFFFFFSPTWIAEEDYMNIDTSIKKFKVSSLTGLKLMCEAHNFRQRLYMTQDIFNSDYFTFFRSSSGPPWVPDFGDNPMIGKSMNDKIQLFKTFQFSIVIENTREANCFTEKLMDCLITKTIPIYYGCENIGEFFNTNGWIIIETTDVSEIYDKFSSIDQEHYSKYKDVIEENYKKTFDHIDIYGRLHKFLTTLPAPNNGLFE